MPLLTMIQKKARSGSHPLSYIHLVSQYMHLVLVVMEIIIMHLFPVVVDIGNLFMAMADGQLVGVAAAEPILLHPRLQRQFPNQSQNQRLGAMPLLAVYGRRSQAQELKIGNRPLVNALRKEEVHGIIMLRLGIIGSQFVLVGKIMSNRRPIGRNVVLVLVVTGMDMCPNRGKSHDLNPRIPNGNQIGTEVAVRMMFQDRRMGVRVGITMVPKRFTMKLPQMIIMGELH